MTNTLKVAFIGGGHSSAVGPAHLAALRMDHRFSLVCGCFSTVAASNQKTADLYHIPHDRVYTDAGEMLAAEKDNIDLAIILTPQDLHLEHIQVCIANGIDMICEKSMVSSVEDAKLVVQDTQENNRFLAVIFNYTGYPMVRCMAKMIEEELIGDVQYITADMPQETFQKRNPETGKVNRPQAWRCKDETIPTVSLDLGVHLVHMVEFISGKTFQCLAASYNCYGQIEHVIDSVSVVAHLSDNVTCQMKFGKHFLGHRNGLEIEIYGSLGMLSWVQSDPEHLIYVDQYGQKCILDRGSPDLQASKQENSYHRFKAGHPSGFVEALANYYLDIANAYEMSKTKNGTSDKTKVFHPKAALRGLSVMDAIDKSAKTKHWIQI